MISSEQINEIAAAIAKAQATLANPIKSMVNPHFRSKYADLASGLEIVREALSAVGVALFQPILLVDDGSLVCETRLVHTSGQWVSSHWPIGPVTPDQQKMGSACTYARRYGLFSLVGIAGDVDDDGNEASKPDKLIRQEGPIAPPAIISPTERELLETGLEILGERGDAFRRNMLAGYGLTSVDHLPKAVLEKVMKKVNALLTEKTKLIEADAEAQ